LAQIFPEWTNKLPLILILGAVVAFMSLVGFFWYYGSPKYTDVGFRPTQPIKYSHKLHAGDLGIDCRYCHTSVEKSAVANVPPTQTCMNCHSIVKADSDTLRMVRESFETGKPIEWVRVHKIGEFAYFNHSIHINKGIGCISCHGNVAQMEEVTQKKPLSMGWCLDCHRNPEEHLRPPSEVTNMKYEKPENQLEFAAKIMRERKIKPPVDCSGCHR
jgi:hypothetical protein